MYTGVWVNVECDYKGAHSVSTNIFRIYIELYIGAFIYIHVYTVQRALTT